MSDPYCVTGFALELYITAPSDGLCFYQQRLLPIYAAPTYVKAAFFGLFFSPNIDIIVQVSVPGANI